MTAFRTPVDIGNRALQHCGADRISSFTEDSKRASEVSFVYDKVREAELKRNLWDFATRRTTIRAIATTTMLLVPAMWSAATTYYRGSIVADQDGGLWISNIAANLNNDPLLTTFWEPYFGPMTVSSYDSTVAYGSQELVYTYAGDGTYRVYQSLIDGNSDVPATATAWDATVTYAIDQIATYSSVAYKSLINLNLNQTPSTHPAAWTTSFTGGSGSINWLEIGGVDFPNGVSLTTVGLAYPIGSGPLGQSFTRNAFKLPAGYFRLAPQNPKTGLNSLGGPSGYVYNDWNIENGYLVTADAGPIALRFVANVTDVAKMDTMFCEGLAARIGIEIAQPITQSDARLQTIASLYKRWMDDARAINAIEVDFVDPPDDELISVRI